MYMKMQESVLKRVYKMEEKNNIHYATKNGGAFSTCRVLTFIFAVWAVFFAVIVAVGYIFSRDVFQQGTAEYIRLTKYIVSCFSFVGLLVVCMVLNGFKKAIASGIFALSAAVYGSTFFAQILYQRTPNGFFGIPYKYYWAHLLPLVVVAICAIVMAVIAVREQLILKREYKQVSARLYEEYSKLAEDLSEEQWEEFLNNYNPKKNKKQ